MDQKLTSSHGCPITLANTERYVSRARVRYDAGYTVFARRSHWMDALTRRSRQSVDDAAASGSMPPLDVNSGNRLRGYLRQRRVMSSYIV
jgi:hypothetical protein